MLSSTLEKIIPVIENVNFGLGLSSILLIVSLYVLIVLKNKKNKEMQATLANLQNTYNDLDNQAKLIIKTDLELHKTQSELDKKIIGLYTLHKISRVLSTTLDEEEIFQKISEEYLSELGFDKIFAFLISENKTTLQKEFIAKLHIGYNTKETEEILSSNVKTDVFAPTIKQNQVVSNIDSKIPHKALESILKTCKINSFICAPISTKDGVVGAILVGSESVYSPITLGDKEVVSILAAQIGQALENAKLFEETWRSHQELETKVSQRTKELRTALEEIKIITKRKSDFVSAVAHELRTPLTSIKGYAALLSAGKLGEVSPGVKERLEKINKHSDGLSNLINNILDISRIESGRVEMKIEEINIREMLDLLADLLAPQFKEKQINFIQDIPDDIRMLPADQSQLKRVFINLISNALKFTPPQGKITVRIKRKDEGVQIDVSDTGSGIAEKNLSKIFEEFYREDNETNQNVKGTGLGLSLVKYIVEAHKGKIWVTSKLNQGTTFSFTLPLDIEIREENKNAKN